MIGLDDSVIFHIQFIQMSDNNGLLFKIPIVYYRKPNMSIRGRKYFCISAFLTTKVLI